MKYLVFFILFLIPILAPDTTQAAGLVPCGGPSEEPCTACHLIDLGNNVIGWLIGVLMVVFAIVAVSAGFGLVTSGGNTQAKEDAKKKMTSAIIGLIIVLAGWLIVDTVMRALLNSDDGSLVNGSYSGTGPWSEIQCAPQPTVSEGPQPGEGTPDGGTEPETGGGNCLGGDCVRLSAACKTATSCSVAPGVDQKLNAFHAAIVSGGVSGTRVTEAMPPTFNHLAQCHNDGTCVDYGKSGGMTAQEINIAINAARANGLVAEYEVSSQAQKDALVAAGVPASNILVWSRITAPHFSVYDCTLTQSNACGRAQ